jgi:hypothetical protein
VWFLATPSAAAFSERRAIIRSTWQAMYNSTNLTLRFVLARIDPEYASQIHAENQTHGDLISLSWLDEDYYIANTIKPIEFFRYLIESNQKHQFVSKIDDDSFLNVPAFWDEYIEPRLFNDNYGPSLIGRKMEYFGDDSDNYFIYPGGQFYTMSWEVMEIVVEQFARAPDVNQHEDVLIGKLLNEAGANYTFVPLDNRQAFDYDPDIDDPEEWGHKVFEGAINPHRMKTQKEYLAVANLFDEYGLNLTRLEALG